MSKTDFTFEEKTFGFAKEKTKKMIANGAGLAGLIFTNTLMEAVYGAFIPGWLKPYTGLISAYGGWCTRNLVKDHLDGVSEATMKKLKAISEE